MATFRASPLTAESGELPSGGGINSSLTVTLPSALQDGDSIAVAIKFAVSFGGTLRMQFDVPLPECRLPNNSACQIP